ncbi:MAG: DUF4159 domain-containing protein [Longimicrobiales bacterium]
MTGRAIRLALFAAGTVAVAGASGAAYVSKAYVAASSAAGAPSTSQTQQFPFAEYDGRFTFVRVQYDMSLNQYGRGNRGGGNNPPWYHDYPKSDRSLSLIISEVTHLRTSTAQTNIMRLDDPAIFKFPILYMSEPGYWHPSEKDVEALRAYLTKGGFIIFDDFAENDWPNFAVQMKRVMPGITAMPLDGSEPVWRTFFDIGPEDLHMESYRGTAEFLGMFEENDKRKRQFAMIDYKNDIGEFMEYSGMGFFPVNMSNEAFKLGVNFIIYAVTH